MELSEKKLYSRLRRYISSLLSRPEDVDDVAQESYLKVLEAGSRGEIRFEKAYLYRTARNLSFNKLMQKASRPVDSIEDWLESHALAHSASLEDDVIGQQHFELFCRAAAALPEQCRRVLILRKVYGLSQLEVAELLGISVSTVEKHLAKGLVRCRDHMARQGYLAQTVGGVKLKK